MEFRTDAATVTLQKTKAGYVRLPGKLTRTGVFPYVQPDGSIVRELRHPDDVFHEDSLDSLRLVPVTHNHPKTLDAKTAREYARGAVGEMVCRDGDFISATVGIFDAALVQAIEAGTSELSCGYHCDFDETPGEYNGEPYDVRQINIRYNHLAVVDRGRAGRDVALKLDSAEKENVSMSKVKIGDVEHEVPAEVASAFEALTAQQKADSAERDAQKARADAAEGKTVDVRPLVKARVALEKEAGDYLAAERMDSLDDVGLKTEVIKALLPSLKLDGYDASQIDSAYAVAIAAKPSKSASGLAAVRQATRNDSAADPFEEMKKRQANAWKGKK